MTPEEVRWREALAYRCWEKSCCGNVYRSRRKARRAAKRWRVIIGSPMVAYRCVVCGLCHVASRGKE